MDAPKKIEMRWGKGPARILAPMALSRLGGGDSKRLGTGPTHPTQLQGPSFYVPRGEAVARPGCRYGCREPSQTEACVSPS